LPDLGTPHRVNSCHSGAIAIRRIPKPK
jgi:hypothetical protein